VLEWAQYGASRGPQHAAGQWQAAHSSTWNGSRGQGREGVK